MLLRVLAEQLRTQPDLLILEEALRGYDGALAVASHDDASFVDAIAAGRRVELRKA